MKRNSYNRQRKDNTPNKDKIHKAKLVKLLKKTMAIADKGFKKKMSDLYLGPETSEYKK